MMKLLDGWKNVIVVVALGLALAYQLLTGHDVKPMVEMGLKAMGWSDVATPALTQLLTVIVPLLVAIYTSADKALKAWKQYRAGATPTEVLTDIGAVKKAIAEGVIPSVPISAPKG